MQNQLRPHRRNAGIDWEVPPMILDSESRPFPGRHLMRNLTLRAAATIEPAPRLSSTVASLPFVLWIRWIDTEVRLAGNRGKDLMTVSLMPLHSPAPCAWKRTDPGQPHRSLPDQSLSARQRTAWPCAFRSIFART